MRLAQLIILLILFFTSCKSEEEPQNYIEVDGRKYELGTSHVSYYDRLNDAGELNHFYQIQVFGKNYKVQFDSDGKFYSENGDDFYLFFSLESKQAVRLEKTFYKNTMAGGRDTTSKNEYRDLSLTNLNGSRLMMDYQKMDSPIYVAMENRQLEILVENIEFFPNHSAADSTVRKVNIHYKGRYHYKD